MRLLIFFILIVNICSASIYTPVINPKKSYDVVTYQTENKTNLLYLFEGKVYQSGKAYIGEGVFYDQYGSFKGMRYIQTVNGIINGYSVYTNLTSLVIEQYDMGVLKNTVEISHKEILNTKVIYMKVNNTYEYFSHVNQNSKEYKIGIKILSDNNLILSDITDVFMSYYEFTENIKQKK